MIPFPERGNARGRTGLEENVESSGDMLASRCLSEIYMKLSNFQTFLLKFGGEV